MANSFLASPLPAEPVKRVLVINSYHSGYPWSDDEMAGLHAEFADSQPEVFSYVEFADSQRHSGQEYEDAWLSFTLKKYRGIPLDLLIATDDYAGAEALKIRALLNPNLPIVFCGMNDYKGDSWILRQPLGAGLVGVLENVTHLETARFALRLLPRSNQIVVVDPSGDIDYASDLQRVFPGIRARNLTTGKLTANELGAELAKLKEGSFVITSSFFSDANGEPFSMESSIRWVTSHSPVPVFGISKRSLGQGIVGGKLSDGFSQGKTAGRMALEILRGIPPAQLSTVSGAGESYLIDYAVFQRWNLDEARLPAGTIVIGRPASLYSEHRTAVWAALAFLAFQSMVIGLLGLEVKRRKRTEDALEVSAQHYRAIFEQSPIGIVEVALDGGWELANDKACEIVGESRTARLGKTVQDLISEEDWKVVADSRANLLRGSYGSFSGEMELIQKSGKKIWVHRTISLIKDGDLRPKVFMMMLEDITRSKEAEQQLLRSNAALRHFAYAAAHDLQEPLRNVALASDLLASEYKDQLDELGQRLLSENLEASRRMLGMVEALFAYSLAVDEAKTSQANVVETEIALTRALKNLHASIDEADVKVVHSDLPAVRASEVHVVELFQNLIGNAVKYRKKEGLARVSVSARPNGAEWIFEVADNGIGFDPAYAERIFGVFKRLHSRREYPGTGIGLAICVRIVEHYGGRIWAESKPSAGARFFFSLPAAGRQQ